MDAREKQIQLMRELSVGSAVVQAQLPPAGAGADAAQQRQLLDVPLTLSQAFPHVEAMIGLVGAHARALVGAYHSAVSLSAQNIWPHASFQLFGAESYASWRPDRPPPVLRELFAQLCGERRALRMSRSEMAALFARLPQDEAPAPAPQSWLAAPLSTRDGRYMGVLQLWDGGREAFSDADDALVAQLLQLAVPLIEHAQLYQFEHLARRRAERAIRLHALSTALANALTPEQVADAIVSAGFPAAGAYAGVVVQLSERDMAPELLRGVGAAADALGGWLHAPSAQLTPLADAIRMRAPIWLGSPDAYAARYPALQPAGGRGGAWAILPLLAEEQPIGAICLSFALPHSFGADEQALMRALAQQSAQALARARLYVAAEAAVAARDELLSVVSHDLKNPLSTIKGYTQLVRRRAVALATIAPDMDRVIDGLDKIDLSASRMAVQIADLLDTASLHGGQPLELDRRDTDLVALLRQMTVEYQQTSQSHTLLFECCLPALAVLCDSARIERVFANLLQNAIKYSPHGGAVRIALDCERRADSDWAKIMVIDSGVGIPAEDLPHIFERFHRAGNVTSRIKGTGIGLSSARQIIEQHGGTIQVTSNEGVGSIFVVHIPL